MNMGRNKIDNPLEEGVVAKDTDVKNILELISGPSLQFEYGGKVFIHEGWNHIYLRSNSSSATCPIGKEVSTNKHGVYERNPQWLPLDGRPTRAHIKVNRFKCKNPECRVATFSEKIGAPR